MEKLHPHHYSSVIGCNRFPLSEGEAAPGRLLNTALFRTVVEQIPTNWNVKKHNNKINVKTSQVNQTTAQMAISWVISAVVLMQIIKKNTMHNVIIAVRCMYRCLQMVTNYGKSLNEWKQEEGSRRLKAVLVACGHSICMIIVSFKMML